MLRVSGGPRKAGGMILTILPLLGAAILVEPIYQGWKDYYDLGRGDKYEEIFFWDAMAPTVLFSVLVAFAAWSAFG